MPQRILVPAEMCGRELVRRRGALGLLTALPLAFYLAQSGHNEHAPVIGGIAMAFSLAGASIFAALTARAVDERLALAGYRPIELLLGRLIVLEAFGGAVAALFSIVMVIGSNPAHPWLLAGGVELVAVTSVPFGLAVGALAPHELEGVLIMIGAVGIQLSVDSTQTVAKALPFWGPQRVIQRSLDATVSIGVAIAVDVGYAAILLAAAAYVMHRRAGNITRRRLTSRRRP
jgi:hypothetical protein